jgi:NADH-quinone oxidoreductase subunit J
VIETLLLYLFAGSALLGAVAMLVARHPMRAALALIATMLSLAGVYALLGVHVIAVFQVLIYVGAVMVFMVYVIMLLDVRDLSFAHRYSHLLVPGLLGFVLLTVALVIGLWHGVDVPSSVRGDGLFGVQAFSIAFLNEYWLHFELVSVLLLAAVVAAIAVVKVGSRHRG